MTTQTKGNIVIENIKVGDILYEFDLGMACKSKVLTLPVKNEDGQWEWTSENLTTGEVINYLVDPEYVHYGPNLWDYNAYKARKFI